MTVNENIKLYKCDFCTKKLFVKHAMANHENFCGNNPKNAKACQGCIHLEETEIGFEVQTAIDEFYTKNSKAFRCTKLDRLVYPLIVEKKKLPERFPDTFENQYPMPTNCTFFDNGYNF